MASDSNSTKVHRHEGYLATVQIKPVVFTLLRSTSAELLFSCYTSASSRAAGDPRQSFVPQVKAA
jgi:hypothetical protein